MTVDLDSASVADYLAHHPEFFQEHSELLARVQLTSPLTGRAVSLSERQMEVMRGKYKALELKLGELVRLAQENDGIVQKFHIWTQALLQARNDVDLPHILIEGLRSIYGVPWATLRLWRVAPEYCHTWFVQDVSEDAKIFANSLAAPYCGENHDFEAVRWLEEAPQVRSTAILPLRAGKVFESPESFGLLILGSPDPQRFSADMATDFLVRISETAGSALTCLIE
ncbi:DUF484 family protein [Massilia sp. W12]|uniref:DUF484 family protein n=1 Tax=Massilia sp. W12 TaxID=3126507 RepID=UPI0030CDA7E7